MIPNIKAVIRSVRKRNMDVDVNVDAAAVGCGIAGCSQAWADNRPDKQ